MPSESDTAHLTFLKTAPTLITRSELIIGANDRVRIGVCGLRGRGKDHIDAFAGIVKLLAPSGVNRTVVSVAATCVAFFSTSSRAAEWPTIRPGRA